MYACMYVYACMYLHMYALFYVIIIQWRRKMPKSGGGAHIHVIYVPSVKNQYKRALFGYMVIYEQRSVSVY